MAAVTVRMEREGAIAAKSLVTQMDKWTKLWKWEVAETTRFALQDILTEIQNGIVPVDTGRLRDSGYIEEISVNNRRVAHTIGFRAPYAVRVHENPRAGQTGGVSPRGKKYRTWARTGRWKYLEEPMRRHGPVIHKMIAERVRRSLTETLRRRRTG